MLRRLTSAEQINFSKLQSFHKFMLLHFKGEGVPDGRGGMGVVKGANGTYPLPVPTNTPYPYQDDNSSQSSLFSVCIMADLEKQNIAIELRKFRKKLRQIEKLEELERDLTEEEFLKVTDS